MIRIDKVQIRIRHHRHNLQEPGAIELIAHELHDLGDGVGRHEHRDLRGAVHRRRVHDLLADHATIGIAHLEDHIRREAQICAGEGDRLARIGRGHATTGRRAARRRRRNPGKGRPKGRTRPAQRPDLERPGRHALRHGHIDGGGAEGIQPRKRRPIDERLPAEEHHQPLLVYAGARERYVAPVIGAAGRVRRRERRDDLEEPPRLLAREPHHAGRGIRRDHHREAAAIRGDRRRGDDPGHREPPAVVDGFEQHLIAGDKTADCAGQRDRLTGIGRGQRALCGPPAPRRRCNPADGALLSVHPLQRQRVVTCPTVYRPAVGRVRVIGGVIPAAHAEIIRTRNLDRADDLGIAVGATEPVGVHFHPGGIEDPEI